MSQSNECDPTENEVEYATVDLQKLRFIGESKTQTRMDIEDVLSDARVLESKIENFYRYRGKVKEDAASTQYHNEQMRIQHTQMIAKQIRKRVDEIQEAGKDLRSDFQNLQANKCIPGDKELESLMGDAERRVNAVCSVVEKDVWTSFSA